MARMRTCKQCRRQLLDSQIRDKRCVNCVVLRQPSQHAQAKVLVNEILVDTGRCQVCGEYAATSLWNSADNLAYCGVNAAKADVVDLLLSMFDMTAICARCRHEAVQDRDSTGHTETTRSWVNLCDAVTVGEALLAGEHATKYAALMTWARRVRQQLHERLGSPSPTSAPPGSAAKIAELSRRAASGVALWHPLDAQVPVKLQEHGECAGERFYPSQVKFSTIQRIKDGQLARQRQAWRAGALEGTAAAFPGAVPARSAV